MNGLSLEEVIMELEIREGKLSDLEEIIRIYEKKEHFLSLIWSGKAEEARRFYIESLRNKTPKFQEDQNFKMFIASEEEKVKGYLILFLNLIETITGEEQAFIFDYGIDESSVDPAIASCLIGRAVEAAGKQNLKYLVVEIFCDDKRGEVLFKEMGFKKEIHRIIKKLEMNKITPPQPDPFNVREACNEDMFFILWLNTQCASFTIPPGRDKSRDDVQYRYLRVYSGMSLEDNENLITLIIEDAILDKPAGYLFLKIDAHDAITGERLGYIYDIAIHPDYWGKRAAQRLVREGENLLIGKGINYCIGDISEDNQRALKTATKSVGFKVERVRWMKKIDAIFNNVNK